jgi:uncharacterized coiled-coil DUF342 family protein
MSDTPRTDEQNELFPMGGFTLDFARQLERELAEAINEISGLKEAVNLAESEWDEARSDRDAYYRELADAREQRDMLADALETVLDEVRNDYMACKDEIKAALAAVKGGSHE